MDIHLTSSGRDILPTKITKWHIYKNHRCPSCLPTYDRQGLSKMFFGLILNFSRHSRCTGKPFHWFPVYTSLWDSIWMIFLQGCEAPSSTWTKNIDKFTAEFGEGYQMIRAVKTLSMLKMKNDQRAIDHFRKDIRICKYLDQHMVNNGKKWWLANSLSKVFQDVVYCAGDVPISQLEEQLHLMKEFLLAPGSS